MNPIRSSKALGLPAAAVLVSLLTGCEASTASISSADLGTGYANGKVVDQTTSFRPSFKWCSKLLLALIDSCTTGIDASGNAWTRTDQVPWSMPHESTSAPTQVGATVSLISSASAGSPGAGYSTANSSGGNP